LKTPLPPRLLLCAALLLLPACQNVPKYKRSNGKFDEWGSYQGDYLKPSRGTDVAIDTTAQTVTVVEGDDTKVLLVTPDTRIMHDGDDITLAQLPLNQTIKFTCADDHKHLRTLWYGTHTNEATGGPGAVKRK